MAWAAAGSAQEPQDAPAQSCPQPAMATMLPPAPDRTGAPVTVYARELDASKADQGEARGHVEMYRADQYLETERILYHPPSETVTIPGRVSYRDQQVWINGSQAEYSFLEESGSFTAIDYGLTGSSANGSADSISLTSGHTSVLKNLLYTTCPGSKPDWELSANELELRHEKGFGVARGARLEFKGIPILYAPYFTFPIDDRRKSGFLYPSFSSTNDNGFEFAVPVYWNIAPNQDATIEPRYFTDRGFMLSGEYRFLTHRTTGSLDFDYLPNDQITDKLRYYYRFQHFAQPWRNWRTELNVDRVSDDQYFQDFGASLYQTSQQFLRSSARITGVGRSWTFEVMADDFQVIDNSVRPQNEPYRRVPRLEFLVDKPLGTSGLSFGLDSELVYFDRDVGVTGARLDLYPRLVWDRYAHWGFVKPSAGFRYTSYGLDLPGEEGDENPDRALPILSLDTGLYFDRFSDNGDTQTLEPRVFYLYVPHRDQSDLPDFDTGEFTFGFSQLFNTNRFAGADRQSDANQVSVAVTTRNFRGATGRELWSFSIGQIFYFEPNRIFLNDPVVSDSHYSPLIAEFAWFPSTRISTLTGLQWDWENSRLDVASIGLRWSGQRGQRVSFEYRYRRERVDQFDFRIYWPINERWRALSRVNYSFADDDMLEIQGGVEYESCCWAVRTVYRRYLKNRDGDFRDGIFFELNLKGLASLGTRAQGLFQY